jgi:hypothetical protein
MVRKIPAMVGGVGEGCTTKGLEMRKCRNKTPPEKKQGSEILETRREVPEWGSRGSGSRTCTRRLEVVTTAAIQGEQKKRKVTRDRDRDRDRNRN